MDRPVAPGRALLLGVALAAAIWLPGLMEHGDGYDFSVPVRTTRCRSRSDGSWLRFLTLKGLPLLQHTHFRGGRSNESPFDRAVGVALQGRILDLWRRWRTPAFAAAICVSSSPGNRY